MTSLKNMKIFSMNRASHSEEVYSCSYSLYNHTQELLKTGTKIFSEYFFCRSCKAAKRKELATKCVDCDSDIALCNSWLISALSGGCKSESEEIPHDLQQK